MPAIAYHKGSFMPLEEANVGIMTHALHYGTAVFEGIRGNWNNDHKKLYIFRLREHMERLLQGCSILRMMLPLSVDDLCDITVKMVEQCGYTEDIYIRPVAYKSAEKVANLKLPELEDDFFVLAIPFGKYIDSDGAIKCCTSSWRRTDDTMIPPRVKLAGIYINSILAKSDAVLSGFDEAILLNQDGHVCEGSGENIFVIKDGAISTPSLDSNVLPGITRDTVKTLIQQELGLNLIERSIDRSELYLADEVFLTGTAAHLTPVGQIDHRNIQSGGVGPITKELSRLYFQIVRGDNAKYIDFCTPVSPNGK